MGRITKTSINGTEYTIVDETALHEGDLPTTLPNPHKLFLVGGSTAEYDGSSEVTVEIPSHLSDFTDDATHRVVTDEQIELWDAKVNEITKTNVAGALGYIPVKSVNNVIPDANGNVVVQAQVETPSFVDGIAEMTDISKSYINTETGTVWVYKETTFEEETIITDNIVETDDNLYYDNSRFGSSEALSTQSGYVVTPFIDLSKYSGKTIELHLEGNKYITETQENFIMYRILYDDKSICVARAYTKLETGEHSIYNIVGLSKAVINNTTSATLTITPPVFYASSTTPFRYIAFCGLGTKEASNIYITYKEKKTVTRTKWVDTGVAFGGSGIDNNILEKISKLNNENADPVTVKLLPTPVLEFYNTTAYPNDDYTVTHLEKITYPCRADIPVPFTVKWEYNENAMRTTVAIDTKAIGATNVYSMFTYDATGLNKYPLYNLMPNKTYYYKVIHIMSDGSIVEAKSGSFTTSSESWRLIYIDGTQNVRDLGGWTALGGKKVKYGKIFRGATFSDSSFPELILTGKGRRALGELKIQSELNLGAADAETSIAANCSYKKIYYQNYATAFTDAAAKENFKNAIEYIVECLIANKNIYMHCQGGCDRTGTLSFQLLGLLGVSESDLAKEYELSSFSMIGYGRRRTTTQAVDTYDYVGMVQALKAYTGDTLADKLVAFATECGVTAETITSLRNLMLE